MYSHIVDCGIPVAPLNGSLGNYSNTKEDTNVTFWCDEDFVPTEIMIATCNSRGMWDPDPAEHYCEFVEGTLQYKSVVTFPPVYVHMYPFLSNVAMNRFLLFYCSKC